jgi:hypothetical protein
MLNKPPPPSTLPTPTLEALAQERGNHGDIKGAVNALQSKDLLLVRKDASVAAQWKEKSDVARC